MNVNLIAIETLQAAKDSAEWAFWAMLGTWVSGIMTLLAVCVSLIVAFRRPMPKLKCTASISLVGNSHVGTKVGVGISVYNRGANTVNIVSIIWNFSKTTRLVYAADRYGNSLPKKIEHGESASIFFCKDEEGELINDIKNKIEKYGGDFNKLKFEISLGTGDKVFVKPSIETIEFLLK